MPGWSVLGQGHWSPVFGSSTVASRRAWLMPENLSASRASSSYTSAARSNAQSAPQALAKSIRIRQSSRASPGGSTALRTRCTRRSELVKTPSFSAKTDAGKTTSAKRHVSFMKASWTTTNSAAFIPFSSSRQLGSERTTSSPMTKSPLMLFPTCFIITFRLSPGSGDSVVPHAASYRAWTSGSSTRW